MALAGGNSATPPPLGFRNTHSPADTHDGSSNHENSHVAVTKTGIRSQLVHDWISGISRTLSAAPSQNTSMTCIINDQGTFFDPAVNGFIDLRITVPSGC